MTDSDDMNKTKRGATQLVPPYIESGMRDPKFGILLKEWAFLLPAAVPPLGSVLLNFLTGDTTTFRLTLPAGGVLAVVCWTIAQATDWEFFSPTDTATGWKRRFRDLRRFPLSREEFVSNAEHGYVGLKDNGFAEMQDGRLVCFVKAPSRNTNKQDESDANDMILRLTAAMRREFPNRVAIWQTTFDTDPDEYLQQWRETRHSGTLAGRMWRYARAYLDDMFRHEAREESSWDPRKRMTIIAVEVSPHEVRRKSTAESSEESVGEKVKDGLRGSDGITPYQRKQMTNKLNKRVKAAERVARSVAETEVERQDVGRLGPGEHALLVAKYWRGVEPNFDDLSESDDIALSVWPDVGDYAMDPKQRREASHRPIEVAGADDPRATASVTQTEAMSDGGEVQTQTVKDSVAGPEVPEEGTAKSTFAEIREGLFSPGDDNPINDSVIQDRLAPSEFDVEDGYITAGEQLCRSYWLAGWPKEPASNFLEELQGMRGVDYDLIVRGVSPHRSDAINWLEEKIKDSGATIEELSQSNEPETGVLSGSLQYYTDLYKLFKKHSARPWWVNMYVTIRVGPKRAFEVAEEESVQGYESTHLSPAMAKRQALDSAVDRLLETVEDEPAAMDPIMDTDRADLLFKSCFPASRDVYNEDVRKNKRSITATGSLAATFLFSTATVLELDGVLYGRHAADGQKIVANQFDRDGAAHRLTGGRSGSGKTVFVGDQGLMWWLGGDPIGTEPQTEPETGGDDT